MYVQWTGELVSNVKYIDKARTGVVAADEKKKSCRRSKTGIIIEHIAALVTNTYFIMNYKETSTLKSQENTVQKAGTSNSIYQV